MKIKLTEQEIGEIVKEWAMQMYRTKNVSVEYEIDMDHAKLVKTELVDDYYVKPAKLNHIGMSVEITMTDGDYAGTASSLANEAISRVKQLSGVKDETRHEADHTPNFNNVGIPLS